MLDYEDRPPLRDYSQLDFDAAIAGDIRADLAPDNPDRFSNMEVWASLIIEGAREAPGDGPLDVRELQAYLYQHLVPQEDGQTDRQRNHVDDFLHAFDINAIADTAYHHSYDDEGNVNGARSYRNWMYPHETIAKFIAARVEYEELGAKAERVVSEVRQAGTNLTVNDMFDLYERLLPIQSRRDELAAGPAPEYGEWARFQPRRSMSRWDVDARYDRDWPDIDFANFGPSNRSTEGSLMELERRIKVELEIHTALEELGEPEDVTEKYGAKGANLLQLDATLQKLKEAGSILGNIVEIPPFMLVDTNTYRQWKSGEDTTDTILEVKAWLEEFCADTPCVVRSSAVFSEDGEHMGAGVYESVFLPEGASVEEILAALTKVYLSTDSQRARLYRKSIGVADEVMGIVVQRVEDEEDLEDNTAFVTLNTMMPGAPRLSEYTLEDGAHPLLRDGSSARFNTRRLHLDRLGLFRELGSDGYQFAPTAPRFHTPPDTNRHYPSDSWYAGQAGALAEKILDQPVQIEVIIGETACRLLQARPIPDRMLIPEPFFGFPEYDVDDVWYEGRGIGVINGETATVTSINTYHLRHKPEETKGLSLAVFDSSYGSSLSMANHLERSILALEPDERAKIVCLIERPPHNDSASGGGHLETFFAEMGIKTIFYDYDGFMGGRHFAHDQKVKIYSDGYKAVVLSSEDDPAYRKWMEPDTDTDW